MKKASLVLCLLVILSGCKEMMGSLESEFIKAIRPSGTFSKFTPNMESKSDVEDFRKLILQNNKKVVTDELGTYYFNLKGEELSEASFKKTDDELTKSLFRKSKGIVLPVARYLPNYKMIIDWRLTKKVIRFSKRKLNLEVYGLKESKEYLKTALALKHSNSNFHYSFNEEQKILGKLEAKHIKPGYSIRLNNNLPSFVDNYNGHSITFEDDTDYIKFATGKILTGRYLYFFPTILEGQQRSRGFYFMSQCGSISLDKIGNFIKYVREDKYDFPVMKSNAPLTTERLKALKRENEMRKERFLRHRYVKTVLQSDSKKAYDRMFQMCSSNLKHLGIIGRVKSHRIQ